MGIFDFTDNEFGIDVRDMIRVGVWTRGLRNPNEKNPFNWACPVRELPTQAREGERVLHEDDGYFTYIGGDWLSGWV